MTRYPRGSIRELSAIAIPLMLSNLSTNLMLFFDRLIVAQTSTHAMNAAVAIGITCSIFHFAVSAITASSEIFVGRYLGANNYSYMARPIWQMIWLSIFSIAVFAPLAFFADTVLIQKQYRDVGESFYFWYMLCGPIFPLVMALSAFYIGQGKTKFITLIMVVGNVINLLLAFALVLGVKDILPALGLKGAAIATISAQTIQALILFCLFIKKENRSNYHTLNYKIYWHDMKNCLSIGLPMALGYMIELGSWAFLLGALTSSGAEYMTIFAIGQGLFILFAFITEGMQKSVTVLVANFLGAKVKLAISKTLVSAVKLQLYFAGLILVLLICLSDSILHAFVTSETLTQYPQIYGSLKYALLWFWIFFIFDGIKWILAGMLLAFEKALTVVLVNFVTIWIFAILPIYFLVKEYHLPPAFIWVFVVGYSIMNMGVLWYKYHTYSVEEERGQLKLVNRNCRVGKTQCAHH